MICSRGYKEALCTITKMETQKYKGTKIFSFFMFFFLDVTA